ncbi:unnamed protein product [Schistocephalus solidus]|uniref:Dynein light chain n=1 Tax=Schistocephalus solidus TaxID=70667 RepID=A0A183SE95_SCHSO|nr:unnamed protein product [Schistocephalus solidus]
METRSAFGDDTEQMPPIVIVEKTDIKTPERETILNVIRERITDEGLKKPGLLAEAIKEDLEDRTGKYYWHCIIGSDFAW